MNNSIFRAKVTRTTPDGRVYFTLLLYGPDIEIGPTQSNIINLERDDLVFVSRAEHADDWVVLGKVGKYITSFYSGDGDPGTEHPDADPGDMYLDLDTGDVYKWES